FDCFAPDQASQLFATIEGRLRFDATIGPNGPSLNVDVDRLELQGRRWIAAGGVVIGVGGEPDLPAIDGWRAGRLLRGPVSLRRAATFWNPGVRDPSGELAVRGIVLVGSTKSSRLVEVIARGTVLAESLAWARAHVRRNVAIGVGRWSQQSV